MNKKILTLFLAIGGAFVLSSCSARPVAGPQGEQGETGPQGPHGEQGETGPQGEPGKDGENGETPYIGSNGNWWIGDVDTEISAQGPQGEDGHNPDISIGENGNWFIDGVDTGKPATVNETSHIVSFDVQGGTMPAETPTVVQVLEGATIDTLPIPTRKDYKFLGWFTGFDVNAGQFTTTTPVYDDLQLFARWESLIPETYTITWINYDGTVLEIDEAVQYGVVPTYDGVIPTKPSDVKYSYVFDGWSPEIKVATENVTYVAQYSNTIAKHTIIFDLGEYGNLTESVINIDGGDSIITPCVDYTNVPDNYALTGWYFDDEFNDPVKFPYIPNTDLTIYGKREEITDVTPYLTFYYDETRNGYILRSYNEVYPLKVIRIPDTRDDGTYGERPVVGMNSTFSGNQNIETIILPETFKFIGERAFSNSSVAYVDFPKALETISESAFENCNLTSVTLPEGLQSIGTSAFKDCVHLTSVTFPKGLLSLKDYAFSGSGITSVTLPEGLQSIGKNAFQYCYYLTSVKLPEGLLTIGDSAFDNCDNLTSITLPEGLQNIGYCAFNYCQSLTSVTLPESLESIDDYAFSCCYSLTLIIIPEDVEFIGYKAFNSCPLLTIYCLDLSQPSTRADYWNGEILVYRYSPTDPGATTGNYWHYNEEGQPWKW